MSDDETGSLKEHLREISTRIRNDLTQKFITSLVASLRRRALDGYSFYESDPIPDNICKEQLKEWFKKQQMLMSIRLDNSFAVYW